MEFKSRILMIQSIAAILIAIFCVLTSLSAIDKVLTNDKFHETRNFASAIAINPDVIQAIETSDRIRLDDVLRDNAIFDVDILVVAGKSGERLYHNDAKQEGKFISDDNFKEVITGQAQTEIHRGLSGLSIKTRMPVYSHGEVIGMISVGFLETHVKSLVLHYLFQATVLTVLMLSVMLYGSRRFSNYIQDKLSGMSPEQIAQAYQLRKGILNSVAEGVIAVDTKGVILVINNRAIEMLGMEKSKSELFGAHISTCCYPSTFFVSHADEMQETTINVNGETLLATRTAMMDSDIVIGYVASFRRRDTSTMLQLMVSQVAKERDDLRVITHEYANNMAVVSGMLEMGLYDKAQQFIHKENHVLQEDISKLTTLFHPVVAAIILGKKRRASELGYTLNIVDGSSLSLEGAPLSPDEIAAILGNLLDNAYEAVANTDRKGDIELFATDAGAELIIEVSDNGTGVAEEDKESIFRDGYTSKLDDNSPHGVGLALIASLTTKAAGQIVVEDNEPFGAVFSLFIPKEDKSA
ncbi:ATP-binding protein [Photobacterium swingsii]|uniref:ATP-binding protein n=2 Tax=Photobacterium swingsii TaxID=680026 RepID=UPI003D0E1D63